MTLRREAELQVRTLIETSPLAILTLNHEGRWLWPTNRRASYWPSKGLPCKAKTSRVPADPGPMLHSHHSAAISAPTWSAADAAQRRRIPGARLALHVSNVGGPALAAVVWDASENLRDREGAGLDSMMATSRIYRGRVSRDRNLAAAANSATRSWRTTAPGAERTISGARQPDSRTGEDRVHGLRMAANREAVVADLGTVLDEARIVIEPTLREAGITAKWDWAPGFRWCGPITTPVAGSSTWRATAWKRWRRAA